MTKTLERDLGLPAVVAISMGAMIGSGIFILPALAYGVVGPAVVVVYLLAGLLVLPAALSQAELATAMPKSGGAYLYIERGLGPLFGTVAGLGTWFSLTFKSALALVGGVPYLLLLFTVPDGLVTPLALGLATLLVGINLVGAKQTGLTQVAVVALMLVALAWFVVGGGPAVETARFEPFVAGGIGGIATAIGLVFVSYAGVTKVASVAEEIERPDRNIPLGIIGSLLFTTLLYVGIVAVVVGVVPALELAGSATPMADAAQQTLGDIGVAAVVFAAILALVSTANAGVLSASRYPFAMARDRLVPDGFATISDRLGTPSTAITATGAVVLVLVAFVPIAEIAKLASAFQFLVFALVNLAVIVFRESSMEYEPPFRAPLYPWVQVFGIVTSLALLAVIGTVPLVGAVLIVLAGVGWYLVYGRDRVDREGLVLDLARDWLGTAPGAAGSEAAVPAAARAGGSSAPIADGGRGQVVVATTAGTTLDRERTLLDIGAALARSRGRGLHVLRFETVPDQQPLEHAAATLSDADRQFEADTQELATELGPGVDVLVGEVVSHDIAHAIANHVRHAEVDLLVLDWHTPGLSGRWPTNRRDWVRRHVECDVVFVDGGTGTSVESLGTVTVAGADEFHPTAVAVADAVSAAAAGDDDGPQAVVVDREGPATARSDQRTTGETAGDVRLRVWPARRAAVPVDRVDR
ncbi:amino acid permease [Haloarchaeobius baliensis]|uniref:amino acid permease n=1 Tax=Haloarchaeobius baliensis TaxID=1670458 RepID=UPI003F88249B